MLSLVVLCLSALAASSPIPPARRAQVGQGSLAARDSPLSDGVALIDTVNKWRGNYGLPLLAWNDQVRNTKWKNCSWTLITISSSLGTLRRPVPIMGEALSMVSFTSSSLAQWPKSWPAVCKPTVATCRE